MDCQWKQDGDQYKCVFCGFIVSDNKIHKNCTGGVHNTPKTPPIKQTSPPLERPPFAARVFNFAKAAIKHAAKGNPQCTEDEILNRLEICKECELFNKQGDGGICAHKNCGCNLKAQQQYLNKLAWADQECPTKKWLKIEK